MARRRALQNTAFGKFNLGARVPVPLNPFEEGTLLHRLVLAFRVNYRAKYEGSAAVNLEAKPEALAHLIKSVVLKHGSHLSAQTPPVELMNLTGLDLYDINQLAYAPKQFGDAGEARGFDVLNLLGSKDVEATQILYVPFALPRLARAKDTAYPAFAYQDWTLELELGSDIGEIYESVPEGVSFENFSMQLAVYAVYERYGRSVEIPLRLTVGAQNITLTQAYKTAFFRIPFPAYTKTALLKVYDETGSPSDTVITEARVISNGEVLEHWDGLAFKDLLEFLWGMEFPTGYYPIDLSAFDWKTRKLISVVKGHTWALEVKTSSPCTIHAVFERTVPVDPAEKIATATAILGPGKEVNFHIVGAKGRVILDTPDALHHPLPLKIAPVEDEEEEEGEEVE